MKYYSTNHSVEPATLREAVVKGLAADRGLFMPEVIKHLPQSFFDEIQNLSFQEIAYRVADAFFGEDVEAEALKRIVYDTLSFDVPLVHVKDNIYALELFHGPTLAFKDVGARFMARLLQYFIKNNSQCTINNSQFTIDNSQLTIDNSQCTIVNSQKVNVLVATSGDTGSAVANGFLGVEGIHVYVLYPKGKVSPIQECQFTTLGQNITAIEVDGVFDDCQALVKSAFMDDELNRHMMLTSANSINVARFLPQAFYYFYAYAQAKHHSPNSDIVFCVPSGNFGNICSAMFGQAMGLPVKRFIAANNANDVFYNYLRTCNYVPRPSVQTIANAMDVGDPSNFARIAELYGWNKTTPQHTTPSQAHSAPTLTVQAAGASASVPISGATYTNDQIAETMRQCYAETGYVLDPHGACGYRALTEQLQTQECGIFLETAHPAKFKDTVDGILASDIEIPAKLQAFMRGTKQSTPMSRNFADFKAYLLAQATA